MSYFEEHNVDANERHETDENALFVPAELAELLEGMASDPNAKRARQSWMDSLQSLKLEALNAEDTCPVCFKTFGALVAEEEHGLAVESPAFSAATLGACRLPCQHYLCRRCVGEWLSSHNDCPSCRAQCDPEPTTVAQTLLPEIANLPDFLSGLGEHQQAARFDADGGVARMLSGRARQQQPEEREEFSMYS